MLETTYRSVEGVRSAVYEAGLPDAGEAVVFVHGNPGPLDDWESIAPSVAAFARVIAIDLPGFGRADRPRKFDFSVPGFARHLGSLLAQLRVERAHLVLHDFAGAWGVCWALSHPGALASLTLINTLPLVASYRWHPVARIWQTPVLAELFQVIARPWLIASVMQRDNPRPLPKDFVERVLRYCDWRQRMAVNALYRASRDIEATLGPLREGLRALDPPACLVWGTHDKYVPLRFAEEQLELFSCAELHRIENAGHWPFIDEPARVRDVVVGFLRARCGRD